ncbi:hypothetical protein EVAR_79712_1 [Eumeta japonica]|uniref:Uncharacterized protein n=1 Tax=Eumeta variegata TaxID=151549 RepID=A0A4C1TA66_EUMVA|nr:hypothetical protein EVAR_79712_1 [Eumeta japonica]
MDSIPEQHTEVEIGIREINEYACQQSRWSPPLMDVSQPKRRHQLSGVAGLPDRNRISDVRGIDGDGLGNCINHSPYCNRLGTDARGQSTASACARDSLHNETTVTVTYNLFIVHLTRRFIQLGGRPAPSAATHDAAPHILLTINYGQFDGRNEIAA